MSVSLIFLQAYPYESINDLLTMAWVHEIALVMSQKKKKKVQEEKWQKKVNVVPNEFGTSDTLFS